MRDFRGFLYNAFRPQWGLLKVVSDVTQYLLTLPLSDFTFSRGGSSKVIPDHRGVLITVPDGVPAWEGARLATTVADGAELGGELWEGSPTLGAGWTDNGDGTYTCDGSQSANSNLYMPSPATEGKYFRLVVVAIEHTSGGCNLGIGTSNVLYTQVIAVGEWPHEGVAAGTTWALIQASSSFEGIISVSFKQVIPTNLATTDDGLPLVLAADYPLPREDSEEMSEGDKRYVYGQMLGKNLFTGFTTLGTGWADNGDGSFTIDGTQTGASNAVVDLGMTDGALYTLKTIASGVTGTTWFLIGNGSVDGTAVNGQNVITAAADGGSPHLLLFQATAGATGTFSLISASSYHQRPIALEVITGGTTAELPPELGPDDIGVEYTDGTAVIKPVGYSTLEGYSNDGQVTNILTNSEEFDNAAWIKTAINTTGTPPWVDQTSAPDTTLTADLIIPTTANTAHSIQQNKTTTISTLSVFAKANGLVNPMLRMRAGTGEVVTVVFNLTTGLLTQTTNQGTTFTSVSGGIERLANSWFRISLTATRSAGSTNCAIDFSNSDTPSLDTNGTIAFANDGTSGIYLWGGDLKVGVLSAYIPTTTTSATRAADNLSFPIPSVLSAESWAFELAVNPSATGQDAWSHPFSLFIDVRNELTIAIAPTSIRLWERVGDVLTQISFTHAHVAETPLRIQAYGSGNTIGLRVADYSADISAISFIEETRLATPTAIAETLSIGRRNDTAHFVGEYISDAYYASREEAAGW